MTQHDDRHHPTLDNQEHPVNMQMTPELFLSLPHHPEDDHEDTEPVFYADPLQEVASALNRMADSLAAAVRAGISEEDVDPSAALRYGDVTDPAVLPIGEESPEVAMAQAREIELLLAENSHLRGQLDEIRAVVKPSVSKLANAVRAVLDGGEPAQSAPTEAEAVEQPQEPVAQPTGAPGQAEVNPVESGPAYAPPATSLQHYVGQPPAATPAPDAPVEEWRAFARSLGYQGSDVDAANRSQIRTMLGLAHPGQVDQ